MSFNRDDLEFATEYNAALHKGAPRSTMVFLTAISVLFASFLVWADWAELDEVTRGEGRVVPSSRNQIIQSLEGGIVKQLLVRTGDHVKQGDILVRIDDTGFSSNLGELRAKQVSLQAQIARLRHELSDEESKELEFSPELAKRAPNTVVMELQLYKARQRSLKSQVNVLSERVSQRQRELSELAANMARISANLKLAREEEAIKAPLAKRGIVPKTDVLRLKRGNCRSGRPDQNV